MQREDRTVRLPNSIEQRREPGQQILADNNQMFHTDDTGVIKEVLEGKVESYELLVKKYSLAVFKVIHTVMPASSSLEDIAQEVFLKAYESLENFRQESSFVTWLLKIAHNTCIDYLRKQKYRILSLEELSEKNGGKTGIIKKGNGVFQRGSITTTGDIYQNVEERAYRKLIAFEVMKKLSPLERLICVYRFFHELEYSEISRITGIPEGTLRSTLHRMIERVRGETKGAMQIRGESEQTDRQ